MVGEIDECGRILTGRERSARFFEGMTEAPQGSAAKTGAARTERRRRKWGYGGV